MKFDCKKLMRKDALLLWLNENADKIKCISICKDGDGWAIWFKNIEEIKKVVKKKGAKK